MSRSGRSASLSLTSAIVGAALMVSVTPVATAVGVGAPAAGRAVTCAEAWTLVATERAGMAADDASAWQRVSDGFLSISDASFDGPVSNAAGTVSSTSADVASALTSDSEADPPLGAYDAALGALGTACVDLAVTKNSRQVPKFQRFDYQTGTVAGLSSEANARATALLTATVDRAVAQARKATAGPCMAGAKSCAYFVAALDKRPCVAGLVCLRQVWGLLPVGANDSEGVVDALALDALTGRRVPLRRVLPATATPAFLTGLNAAVQKKLADGGLGNEPLWDTTLKLKDVHAWLPQPDGIHVWFERYAVAPGSFGIVHVVVPWPTGTPRLNAAS